MESTHSQVAFPKHNKKMATDRLELSTAKAEFLRIGESVVSSAYLLCFLVFSMSVFAQAEDGTVIPANTAGSESRSPSVRWSKTKLNRKPWPRAV